MAEAYSLKRKAIKAKCIHLSFYLIGNTRSPVSGARLGRVRCTVFPDILKPVTVPPEHLPQSSKTSITEAEGKNTKKGKRGT